MIDRRQMLVGVSAAPVLANTAVTATAATKHDGASDLSRYVGFGAKQAGGPGDNASGEWISDNLEKAGFKVERQPVEVPFFDARLAEFHVGEHRVDVIPQAIVVPTGPAGVAGPLVRLDPRYPVRAPSGSIAVLELPFRRWSTVTTPLIRDCIVAAEQAGAAAALVITTGPTGGAVALNAPADKPSFRIPVAVLAPNDAGPVLKACISRDSGRLVVEGQGGRRKAFNILGRLDRGRKKTIVVSTPRSGWFTCAGERGPGIVAWLELMRWAPGALQGFNLVFSCNSGHEYENAGSEELVRSHAPPPADVALWLHLGAGFAARDWLEIAGPLRPMISADPQRACVATEATLALARDAFKGLAGIEQPTLAPEMRQGEVGTIIAAGFDRTVGLLAAHRFHHHPEDDAQCVDAQLVAPVTAACKALLLSAAL